MEKQTYRAGRNTILYLCIAAAAIGMQLLFRYATLEHLMFMLRPLAFIIEKALGILFYYEPGVGFLSEKANVIINKTCSGTTFWTITFCMLAFSFIPKANEVWKKFTWLFVFFLFSYIMTLFANVSRIIIAIGVLNLKISENTVVERLIHQSIGVLVYCTYLWITYLIFSKFIRKEGDYEKAL